MFYIVTYATHSESYFEILKESCPDIIVLGWGEKWNGFNDKVKGTVAFCKSKKPDDIVCFIDGFDSVVLTSKEDILARYKSLDSPLVISQAGAAPTIVVKYIQDKLFGKCNEQRLNSGLYIGTAESIVDFWGEMQDQDDDQTYATHHCKKIDYMKIDTDHLLFYNYSSKDKTAVRDGALFVNEHMHPTAIISAPANKDINPILTALDFKNLPEIQYNVNYRVGTYAKKFIHEFILLTIIACLIFYVKDLKLSIFISLLLFFSFLEYELSAKHLPIATLQKFLYMVVDIAHMFVVMLIIYFMLNMDCSVQKLLVLNIFYLTIIALFFYFKRCFVSIICQNLTEKQGYLWTSLQSRIFYFFKLDQPYEKVMDKENGNSTELWMDGNQGIIVAILALNLYCLWKIKRGGSCVPKEGYGTIDYFKPVRNIYKKGTRMLQGKK